MTAETEAKLDNVYAALRELQVRGEAPPPGDERITPEFIARLSREVGTPIGASTIRDYEADLLLRLGLAALEALKPIQESRARLRKNRRP